MAAEACPGALARAVLALSLAWAAPAPAQEGPLSAIDWLSQSVQGADRLPRPLDPAVIGAVSGSPLARGALPQSVTAEPLKAASPEGLGLLGPAKTGLPQQLWGPGQTEAILAMIARQTPEPLPALQQLFITLLLAEADPPADAGPDGALALGRIDRLMALGALDQVMAMLQAGGDLARPDLFRRYFDAALLTGAESRACRRMFQHSGPAPTLPARIFCLARNGDWSGAVLTLRSAEVLGQIGPEQAELLARFLDPALAEETGPLDPPAIVTPLDLRLYEAIGEPLPILGLPLAFAHSDLDERTGWKSRLEAAERLSRAGVISPNLLLGFFTLQKPAASGGVWDRVRAFQEFEAALGAGAPRQIGQTLPAAYGAMREVGLEVAFAELFAARLAPLTLRGEAGDLALRLALLTADHQALSAGKRSDDPTLAFALALSAGLGAGASPPDARAGAVAEAWNAPALPPEIAALHAEGRTGELILTGIERVMSGVQGQIPDLTIGLAALRLAGLEAAALRTGLQVLLLDRQR